MFRVGLTGELGSGKSTVARLLAAEGAVVFSSDEMGRALMQPGQPVFRAIVDRFGPAVLTPAGTLDRPALASLAFNPENPRVEELNAIVHPAVLAEQEQQLAALARTQPEAIAVIESALIFTTKHAGAGGPWRTRFDRLILVIAPDELKLARFVARSANGRELSPEQRLALEADGQRRLQAQRISPELTAGSLVLENTGDFAALQRRTLEVFAQLKAACAAARQPRTAL